MVAAGKSILKAMSTSALKRWGVGFKNLAIKQAAMAGELYGGVMMPKAGVDLPLSHMQLGKRRFGFWLANVCSNLDLTKTLSNAALV